MNKKLVTQLAAYRKLSEIIRSEKTGVFAKTPIFPLSEGL